MPFPIQSPELDKLRGLDNTKTESASSWRHCVGPWYFECSDADVVVDVHSYFDFDFDGSHCYSRRCYSFVVEARRLVSCS